MAILSRFSDLTRALWRDALWRRMQPALTLDSGVTVTLRSESDWFVFSEVFVGKAYDTALNRVFNDAATGSLVRVLDLGANSGMFSLRCLDLAVSAGREVNLLAVEGCPPTFGVLKINLSALPGVELVNGLVGQRTGSASIFAARTSFTNRIVAQGEKSSSIPLLSRRAFHVPFIDLDPRCQGLIDLVKCDIEGAELSFIREYERLLRSTRFLVIEFHPRACDVPLAQQLLLDYGFTRELIVRQDPNCFLELYVRLP